MNMQYIRVGDYYIPDLEFGELYRLLNGMPLREMDWIINPVCALCRNHERAGFIHGVQMGIRLVQISSIIEIHIDNCESITYNIDDYRWEVFYGRTKDFHNF